MIENLLSFEQFPVWFIVGTMIFFGYIGYKVGYESCEIDNKINQEEVAMLNEELEELKKNLDQ